MRRDRLEESARHGLAERAMVAADVDAIVVAVAVGGCKNWHGGGDAGGEFLKVVGVGFV